MHRGFSVPAVVTGKPVEIGGSLGRTEATGRGVAVTMLEALRIKGIDPQGATVAVQGFGNVGSVAARLAHEMGLKVIAMTGFQGRNYQRVRSGSHPLCPGISKKTGSMVGFPGCGPDFKRGASGPEMRCADRRGGGESDNVPQCRPG